MPPRSIKSLEQCPPEGHLANRGWLGSCTQVKAKRIFLWFADSHEHAWRERLATEGIDLGRGKRLIVKGGAYDAGDQITVPHEISFSSYDRLFPDQDTMPDGGYGNLIALPLQKMAREKAEVLLFPHTFPTLF